MKLQYLKRNSRLKFLNSPHSSIPAEIKDGYGIVIWDGASELN